MISEETFLTPRPTTQTCGLFAKQAVVITVNPRGPPWLGGGIHSIDETSYDYKQIHAARVCDTGKRDLCKAGRFSYSESLRTPPTEGTSLHR